MVRILLGILLCFVCALPCLASGYQQLLPVPVPVIDGGTGMASLTAHYVLVGEGTGNVGLVAAGTNGQLLIGQTGADPAFMTVSGDATINAAGVISNTKVNGISYPGSFAQGDLLYASNSSTVGNLSDVATSMFLGSGGTGMAPLYKYSFDSSDQSSVSGTIGTITDSGLHSVYIVDVSVGAATATMPLAANHIGQVVEWNLLGNNNNGSCLTLSKNASDTFISEFGETGTSIVLYPSSSYTFVGTSTGWKSITRPFPFQSASSPGSAQTSAFSFNGANSAAKYETQVLGDATSAAFTVTLPSPQAQLGREFLVSKIDTSANAITISPGANNLNGASSIAANNQFETYRLETVGGLGSNASNTKTVVTGYYPGLCAANTVWTNSTGSAAMPTWSSAPTLAGLTLNTTPLGISSGGTARSTLTAHSPLIGNGTGAVSLPTIGTNGQLFLGQTSADPSFQTASGDVASISASGSFTLAGAQTNITSANNMTSASSLATVGTIGTGTWNSGFGNSAFGAFAGSQTLTTGTTTLTSSSPSTQYCDVSGGNITLNLPGASTCGGKIISVVVSNPASGNQVTVNRAGSDTIFAPSGLTSWSSGSNTKSRLTLMSDGSSVWYAIAPPFLYPNPQLGGGTQGVVYVTSNCMTATAQGASGSVLVGNGSSAPSFSTAPSATSATLSGTATNSLDLTGVAGGIRFKSGSNGRIGTFTMASGTATISNTSVTANTMIFPVPTSTNANLGTWSQGTITAGTSIVVNSTNVLDNNTGQYLLIEKN